WRTIINFGMGAFLGIVYQVLGLKLAWTWALLTAVLWYIPYLGPIAAGVPPILDAFVSSDTPWIAVGILSFYTVFVVLEGYVVVPVVMGRSMEMNATTVMLACLFWELVWGSPGLFLAMPLMAAVKAVCHHVPDWRPWANLLSSPEELPAETDPSPPGPLPGGRDPGTRLAAAGGGGGALTPEWGVPTPQRQQGLLLWGGMPGAFFRPRRLPGAFSVVVFLRGFSKRAQAVQ